MIIVDIGFSQKMLALLQSLIGTRLIKVRCDPFTFNNWVYQRVGVFTDAGNVLLKNEIHPVDYFGSEEDICYFEIFSLDGAMSSGLKNIEQIDIPFDAKISEIQILDEKQILSEHGTKTYQIVLVRGISFILEDGREIAFEKTDPFSEEIAISRGHDLISKFRPSDASDEEWDEGMEMEVIRKKTVLK